MDVITSPEALHTFASERRREGRTVGFVPTMGALHAGHLSLIDIARAQADVVIVSTFVNPLQFGDPQDFALYPATHDVDAQMCRDRQVEVLYRPTAHVMYPQGFATSIHVGRLADVFEGTSRPGHFDGVATVVAKLLISAHPHIAVFGAKDFQQVAVIRRMVTDLGLPVRLIVAPTVREPDGLAMSSRNVRLDMDSRAAATNLHRGLLDTRAAFRSGTTDPAELAAIARRRAESVPLVDIDYVHVVDPYGLESVPEAGPDDVVLIAAIVGGVRLIDNIVLGSDD